MNDVARRCPHCGFTGRYRTSALADDYLARHSCDRQRQRDAAERARAERGAGGPRRECLHLGHPHLHGTRPAYVKDRCRCLDCRAANAAASRRRDRDLTYGRWSPFVPAEPVRAHISALRQAGIGRMQIARLAGVSPRHLGVILNGVGGHIQRRVRADTAERILAVRPEAANRAPHRHVDGTGTRRRLQALIALGWPQSWLADELGRHPSNLRRALYSEQVTARTAEDVRELYERLWSTRPPQDTPRQQRAVADALRLATRSRWLAPLAWDDIDHDPEPPTPPSGGGADIDEIAIELAVTGRRLQLNQLTPAEQAVAVRSLTERGKSVRDIAERLGTSTRTVSRRRRGSAA